MTNNPGTTTTTTTTQPMMIRGIQGILFDMDGTLLDTEPLSCKAIYGALRDLMSPEVQESFAERNYLMEWELKQQTLGLPGPQWAKIVLDWSQDHWGVSADVLPTVESFLERWDQNMRDHLEEGGVDACRGAKELVRNLANYNNDNNNDDGRNKKLPLAIATSSHSKSVQQKRRSHEDMFGLFDAIVSADDPAVRHGKPAPDIYLEAARRINVDPKHCLVFEDGMPGVVSGKAAGCFVVAVPDPRFRPEERAMFEETADLVLDDLSQFDISMILPQPPPPPQEQH